MQNSVNTTSTTTAFGIQAGLASFIPVLIWCLLQAQLYPDANLWAPTLLEAVQALWILQAIAIALVLPWYTWHCHWRYSLLQSSILIAIPLPVYSISLLSQALSVSALLQGLGYLSLLAICLIMFIKFLDRFLLNVQAKALTRATAQLGSAILIWTYRDLWLSAILN